MTVQGFVGRALGEPGLKPTVRVGEAAIREVAAYLLDYDHFAQVPHTVLVKFTHPIFHVQVNKPSSPRLSEAASASAIETQSAASIESALSTSTSQLILARRASMEDSRSCSKLGSLQEFVAHDCDTSEIGTSMFSLQDVHRIAILDIRLFNTDRHAGNILVQRPTQDSSRLSALARLNRPQCRLLPIDHGFCLPEALEPPFFEWLHWPQVISNRCQLSCAPLYVICGTASCLVSFTLLVVNPAHLLCVPASALHIMHNPMHHRCTSFYNYAMRYLIVGLDVCKLSWVCL